MSDVKEYWPCAGEIADGNIKISEDVLASIATIAVTETEGVAAAASTVGAEITEMFSGRKGSTPRGVKIRFDEEVRVVWWNAASFSNMAARSPKPQALCRKM